MLDLPIERIGPVGRRRTGPMGQIPLRYHNGGTGTPAARDSARLTCRRSRL